MSITAKKEQTQRAKSLKGKLTTTAVALLITIVAVVSATYAWYIYNTGRHTTKVRMAAGTGVNLQISNVYKEGYKSAAMLESFSGKLNPVSTNRIEGGFQKVIGFTNGSENQPNLVANLFGKSEYSERYKDYYKTSLFLRSNGKATDIYISDISFQDSDEKIPISSAIRVGFVVHKPGENQDAQSEYIFAINNAKNPEAQYNTATGKEGYVLDSDRTDGTTVAFKPYTSDAYCNYNQETGETTLKSGSKSLCTVTGTADGKPGTPVEIEVYIWLEGCDEDCTGNLGNETLQKLAISFAGLVK